MFPKKNLADKKLIYSKKNRKNQSYKIRKKKWQARNPGDVAAPWDLTYWRSRPNFGCGATRVQRRRRRRLPSTTRVGIKGAGRAETAISWSFHHKNEGTNIFLPHPRQCLASGHCSRSFPGEAVYVFKLLSSCKPYCALCDTWLRHLELEHPWKWRQPLPKRF